MLVVILDGELNKKKSSHPHEVDELNQYNKLAIIVTPLCRAERLKLARWASLAKEPACRAERGRG